MNKKAKAKELANRFVRKSVFDMSDEELKHEKLFAKASAIICVEEILQVIESGNPIESQWQYWNDLKKEIDAL